MKQLTDTILMIRPETFRMNEETVVNNYFQQQGKLSITEATIKAQEEFDNFITILKAHKIQVISIPDTVEHNTPDAVFPNNWISFHQNGDVALYPMFAKNRRQERRTDILDILENKGFDINNIIDYTLAENEEVFLEGTGSVVLDRAYRKAYCALSPRSNEDLLIEFCEDFEYTPVIFNAYQTYDNKRMQMYHTNVMMGIGETFAILCTDAIDDKKERKNVISHLRNDHKEIITISEAQIHSFAGNVLQVKSTDNLPYLIMSTTAYQSLTQDQINKIKKHCAIIHSNLNTIETLGGGSARCMMAEVFLPKTVLKSV